MNADIVREEWRVVCNAQHPSGRWSLKASAAEWARLENATQPDHGPHTLESRTVTVATTRSEWRAGTEQGALSV